MSTTTLDSWYPVTKDFGIIQADADTAARALVEWHNEIGIHYKVESVRGDLNTTLSRLQPLSASKLRKLFIPTASAWCVFFQSGIDGSDPSPVMSQLALRLEVLAMRLCSTPPRAPYPATIWEVYAPASLGGRQPRGHRRSLAASKDGSRWAWVTSGEPFPFEEVQRYDLPRIPARLDRALLKEYVEQFGFRAFDEAHLLTEGAILLDRLTPTRHTEEYNLDEVVAGKPWIRGR